MNTTIFRRVITLSLLIMLTSTFSVGQDLIPITLEQVLKIGGSDNLTIQEYKAKQALSQAGLTKAKQWWLPEVYAGAQTFQLWGAAMNSDGRFFLDVKRQNLWSGLGLKVNWDLAEGIYSTKSAALKSEASKYDSKAQKNQTLFKMIEAYYDLQTAQLSYTAYQNLVKQSDSIVQQIQIQVDAGLLYQSELLLAKSNKNHLKVEMLNAKIQYNTLSAGLKKLLNIDQHVKLVISNPSLLPLDYTVDANTTADSSATKRPEFQALSLRKQMFETERKKYGTGMWYPEISIGTYGSYSGRINGNVSPMFPAQYPETNQLYPTSALNVSILWKIPIGELAYQGNQKELNSQILLNEIAVAQLHAQINNEVANALTDIETGKEQIEIAKESIDLTSSALNQSIQRQKLGTAKPYEVFQAQQYFLQAQLDYLGAVSSYNKAQFALKVAKGDML
ncbi:MAG: outer membrane protein TolC [Bacteroidia bacterium]|jgi:outer membrane protein TolC